MDKMFKKIKLSIPKGWKDISNENPDGLPTFRNIEMEGQGALQISMVPYVKGEIPNPTYDDLIGLSERTGIKSEFGVILNKETGDCKYGKYGFTEFSRPDFKYISVWYLSDGKDFIFATHICSNIPGLKELKDVKEILTTIKRKSFFF